ncbi:MAG: hypothetical protein US85_C0016G0010 [Candidatus Shapirobacteria bacterium GW2011_GWF1_38_23]|nr:MAG: hypothetical protein US85_C0016G0010 [Candidatus Shapirobacteria bacterium GW2011_GWF1_38_23]
MQSLTRQDKSLQETTSVGYSEDTINRIADEIKAILTEGEFSARWTLLETYHRVGKLVIENFDHPAYAVASLAVKINRSERTLYYAIAFAKKYPDINVLPEGKNISWNKIITRYLTLPNEKEEKLQPVDKQLLKCPNCGFMFSNDDL